MKKLLLITIIILTAIVCLWPEFKPMDVINRDYRWYIDFSKHAGYYFLVMLLILNLNLKITRFWQITGFFVISIVFELLQVFSINRSVDVRDMLFNLIGILLATGVYYLTKAILSRA
jgi:VanZ family protein